MKSCLHPVLTEGLIMLAFPLISSNVSIFLLNRILLVLGNNNFEKLFGDESVTKIS